jgi:hypothetical protein
VWAANADEIDLPGCAVQRLVASPQITHYDVRYIISEDVALPCFWSHVAHVKESNGTTGSKPCTKCLERVGARTANGQLVQHGLGLVQHKVGHGGAHLLTNEVSQHAPVRERAQRASDIDLKLRTSSLI